jgi:hypothetical protein
MRSAVEAVWAEEKLELTASASEEHSTIPSVDDGEVVLPAL